MGGSKKRGEKENCLRGDGKMIKKSHRRRRANVFLAALLL